MNVERIACSARDNINLYPAGVVNLSNKYMMLIYLSFVKIQPRLPTQIFETVFSNFYPHINIIF